MATQSHADIAAWANTVGALSRRRGAPEISSDSTRDELLAWLQWMDPNGAYSDDAVRAEYPASQGYKVGRDYDLATLQDAWDWLEQQYDWDGIGEF